MALRWGVDVPLGRQEHNRAPDAQDVIAADFAIKVLSSEVLDAQVNSPDELEIHTIHT